MSEKISYERFMEMTEEEWQQIANEDLPEVPKELLTNKIIQSKAERRDGVMGFLSTQEVTNGSNTRWLPIYEMNMVNGEKLWYKLDPTSGLYNLNLTEMEASTEEEPIGKYGTAWMDFMEEHYPAETAEMQFHHRFLTVARSVEKSALDYREILERDFEKMNPRPTSGSFEENLKWNQAMDFYVDSTVMRERVLVPVTKA